MAYVILRIKKLISRDAATVATKHNYRQQHTPNADPAALSRNEELLNHDQRNYWDLATERIAELNLFRLRKDAVRAVEVVLSASPESFPRDANNQTKDQRGTAWVRDNFVFLQDKFGARNIVSFTLHQDEVTPHIHAVVVPVVEPKQGHDQAAPGQDRARLSCRDVFSPASLRQLQTDYANAMKDHGLERGVKYSTGIYEDARRHHGAQQTTQQDLVELSAPLPYQAFELPQMKLMDHLNPQAYLAREQERFNAHIAQQIAVVNQKLARLTEIATANTLAHDKVRVLEKQLATSKNQHDQTKQQLQKTKLELVVKSQGFDEERKHYHQLLVQTAQGRGLNSEQAKTASGLITERKYVVEHILSQALQGPMLDTAGLDTYLTDRGFTISFDTQQQRIVTDPHYGAEFRWEELQPNEQRLVPQLQQALARTQRQQQQQAINEAKMVKLREQWDRWENTEHNPYALRATIIARDVTQADKIITALEVAGAAVYPIWDRSVQHPQLQICYNFSRDTIEKISGVLDNVSRSENTTLHESSDHQRQRHKAHWSIIEERENKGLDRSDEMSM